MKSETTTSLSPQALTPQKRQIEKSLERADSVIRSSSITFNNRISHSATKRTRLFSKPSPRFGQGSSPLRDLSVNKMPHVYDFDENGETSEESCFTCLIKPHEIGFPNPLGTNICWMNSSLQLVLGMKTLIDELESPVSGSSLSRNHYSPILQTFLDVVRQYKKGRLFPVHKDLSKLRTALATLDPGYACESQQDAPEFLIRLLDHFREDFYEICFSEKNTNNEQMALKELQFSNNNTQVTPLSPVRKLKVNPICDNIQFSMKENYCCTSCGSQSSKSQEHLALYVDIPEEKETPASIKSALVQYMKTHIRELQCEKCKGEQCSVNTVFTLLPRILLIQVKRYTCLEHQTLKITSCIGIPRELNLCDFVDNKVTMPKLSQSSENISFKKDRSLPDEEFVEIFPFESETEDEEEVGQKYSYRLTGILSHHGNNPNTGHYVADVFHHVAKRWYHYDDEAVDYVAEDEVIDERHEKSGYLFVYTYRPIHEYLLLKKGGS